MIQWKRLSQWMKMHPISSPIRVKRILHYGLDRDRVGHHDPREQLRVTSLYFFFLHPIFVFFFFKLNFLPKNKTHLTPRSSAEWKCAALITAASLADNFCVFPLIKFLVSFEREKLWKIQTTQRRRVEKKKKKWQWTKTLPWPCDEATPVRPDRWRAPLRAWYPCGVARWAARNPDWPAVRAWQREGSAPGSRPAPQSSGAPVHLHNWKCHFLFVFFLLNKNSQKIDKMYLKLSDNYKKYSAQSRGNVRFFLVFPDFSEFLNYFIQLFSSLKLI